MFHHARGRQLNRAAAVQVAHGNFGAAAVLHSAANVQHFRGAAVRHMRSPWSPWYRRNWLVRRAIRREMVRMSMVVAVAASVPIHETVIVMSPANQLVVLPADSQVRVCQEHTLVDIPEIIEVTFDQEGRKTVLYADRRCTRCGQYFFCYPSDAPPPYDLSAADASSARPSNPPYPAAGYPANPPYPGNPPYPASNPGNPPYPTAGYPAVPPPASNPAYPANPASNPGYPQMPQPGGLPPYAAMPTAPAPELKFCLSCSNESPATSKFCTKCGTKFPVYCTGCGNTLAEGARFCSSCGRGTQA